MERKDLDEKKQQHCYLVSWTNGKQVGHTHIYCDLPFTPPRDTIDFLKTTAENFDLKIEDIIITSIFYFGFIFPQHAESSDEIEDKNNAAS